jgi:hypothetical protein
MKEDLFQVQSDMRVGYRSGGAGILASSAAWLCAGLVALNVSPERAIWTLFIGGMLIHPAGVLLCKLLGSPATHAKDNPLGSLAWGSTLWLIFSLPVAYGAALHRIEWFFPAMLLIIGGRYLLFSSLFGMRIYWALGLSLAAAAYLLFRSAASPAVSAFVGAAIEAIFALGILVGHVRWVRAGNSFQPKLHRGSA